MKQDIKRNLSVLGRLLVVATLLATIPSVCLAQELNVATDKDTYYPGDEIVVENKIANTAAVGKALVVQTRISGVGFTYYPTIVTGGADFEAGEEKEIDFTFHVIDTMPAGKYRVTSSLLEGENLLGEATCFFEVTGTLKVIDMELLACKDKSCNKQASLFYKGDVVYLRYSSTVEGLRVDATLILPDETERNIEMPSKCLITLPGTYILRVTASKEGYKTATKEIEFGALEEQITVLEGERTGLPLRYVIIGAAVVIAIIALALTLKRARKKA